MPGPALPMAGCPELVHSRSSAKNGWVAGSQSRYAGSWGPVAPPNSAASQPWDTVGPEGGPAGPGDNCQGPREARRAHWPGPGPRPLQPGPRGAVLGGGEARKHTESPLPPRLLPLPGSGWGTPIVSLSGSEQTEKRLPGAAGRLTGPSSVSRSADGGASADLSSPAPLGRRGVLPSARLL